MPEKNEENLIDEGLEAIYGKEKNRVDFSKFDRGRPRLTAILLTIVVTLAVIAITAWTAFFVYSRYFTPEEQETFALTIETAETVVSGEETNIFINFRNNGNIPLASLQLDVNLPNSFRPINMTPAPDDEDELLWDMGSLGAGSDGSIAITGIWIANVPSSTPVQVFASYRPANFNADFSEIETTYISTTDSIVTADITGPEEARPGENLDFVVTIKNRGETALEDVSVALQLPDGFFLQQTNPAIEAGTGPVWKFDLLAPLTEQTITFQGTFAADREGFHYFSAETRIQDDNQSLLQHTADGFVDVLRHDLSLQVVANGTQEDVAVELGETLRLTVALENTGDSTIDSANLLVDFQSDLSIPIVWSNAQLDGGTITSDGVYFDVSRVGEIVPGSSKQFNLSFPIDASVGSGQTDAFSLVAVASSDTFEIRSTPIDVAISTEAAFASRVRYYDESGTPLGSGPVPPVVGETTEYRLYWTIENSLHDLENITISASLPPHVEWVGVYGTDLGTITYNNSDRTVTWKVTNLPSSLTHLEANASVRITPDASDLGTFVKLISGSTIKATDVVTGAVLQHTTDSLDTELIGDEFAEGKGVVVEILE